MHDEILTHWQMLTSAELIFNDEIESRQICFGHQNNEILTRRIFVLLQYVQYQKLQSTKK
jgi:hypothetical protein